MANLEDAAFEQFVLQRRKDLQRIARNTQGEHQFSDVVNQAWVVACDLAIRKGVAVDFLNQSFQDLLISHLYQHLVRYTEQNVRRALRLDHSASNEDRDDQCHPVMGTLVSDEGRHPPTVLIERETKLLLDMDIDAHHSQASAYVRLMRRFNNKMQAFAHHLLISVSYAYRRCAYARMLAIHQNAAPLSAADEKFVPGPWRRFRIQRIPEQQAFDFDEELPLGFAVCGTSNTGPEVFDQRNSPMQ